MGKDNHPSMQPFRFVSVHEIGGEIYRFGETGGRQTVLAQRGDGDNWRTVTIDGRPLTAETVEALAALIAASQILDNPDTGVTGVDPKTDGIPARLARYACAVRRHEWLWDENADTFRLVVSVNDHTIVGRIELAGKNWSIQVESTDIVQIAANTFDAVRYSRGHPGTGTGGEAA
jgi:hypothetical protein